MKSIKNKFEYENEFFYSIAENYWTLELPPKQDKIGLRHSSFEFTSRKILQHIRSSMNGLSWRLREKLYEISM